MSMCIVCGNSKETLSDQYDRLVREGKTDDEAMAAVIATVEGKYTDLRDSVNNVADGLTEGLRSGKTTPVQAFISGILALGQGGLLSDPGSTAFVLSVVTATIEIARERSGYNVRELPPLVTTEEVAQ